MTFILSEQLVSAASRIRKQWQLIIRENAPDHMTTGIMAIGPFCKVLNSKSTIMPFTPHFAVSVLKAP